MKNGLKKLKKMKYLTGMLILSVVFSTAACGREQEDTLQEITSEQLQGSDQIQGSTGEESTSGTAENAKESEGSGTSDGTNQESAAGGKRSDGSQTEQTMFVYVCGAVEDAGVYELPEDARIFDALEAAGGVSTNAATELLNLAEQAEDGMRIYVPTREEAEVSGMNAMDQTAGAGTGTGQTSNGKVNINTAGKEELMSLRGIGEAKAESILKYRESHGKFSSIEELMQIDGIKEGVFNKIKEDITI